MVYHNEKMKEINSRIKQLWQQMYTGRDIDYIGIRSSTEQLQPTNDDGSSVMIAGSRSYNYRVVMVKDEVELDMKGRCSAGQKVLACLVIRLALAENFAVQCGILTLDEPTTNLDHRNVEVSSITPNFACAVASQSVGSFDRSQERQSNIPGNKHLCG